MDTTSVAPRYKHTLPSKDALVELVEKTGSVAAAERALGLPRNVIQRRMQANPELRDALNAASRYRITANRYHFPSDDEIVGAVKQARTYIAAARLLGISRQAFKDYIGKRPALKAKLEPHHLSNLAPEQRKQREREKRNALRKQNPERRRLRVWSENSARHGGRPDKECRDYMLLIRGDLCAYCGGAYECVDHIDPVSKGGKTEIANLAPSCIRCNATKINKPLLHFLLYRLE